MNTPIQILRLESRWRADYKQQMNIPENLLHQWLCSSPTKKLFCLKTSLAFLLKLLQFLWYHRLVSNQASCRFSSKFQFLFQKRTQNFCNLHCNLLFHDFSLLSLQLFHLNHIVTISRITYIFLYFFMIRQKTTFFVKKIFSAKIFSNTTLSNYYRFSLYFRVILIISQIYSVLLCSFTFYFFIYYIVKWGKKYA